MLYKAFVKLIKDGKVLGESILVEDFHSLEKAEEGAKNVLVNKESQYQIREYDTNVNNIIGGGDCDTGRIVRDYGNAIHGHSKIMKTILCESDNGVIYRVEKIPNTMFNFYILKRRRFKDGTHQYNICVELAGDTTKYWVLDSIRGHESDAVKRLDEIIKNS